jgi:hypothetical protein
MDWTYREAWAGAIVGGRSPAEQPPATESGRSASSALPRTLHAGDLPSISRMWAYWDGLRTGRSMPSRADLDPAAITSVLPYLLLIDVLRDPLDFRFRLVGTEIDRIVAGTYTGVHFSNLPHMRRGNDIWAAYAQVVASGAPLCSEIEYVGPIDYVRRMAHAQFPLSDDGRAVNMICTVVDIERRW